MKSAVTRGTMTDWSMNNPTMVAYAVSSTRQVSVGPPARCLHALAQAGRRGDGSPLRRSSKLLSKVSSPLLACASLEFWALPAAALGLPVSGFSSAARGSKSWSS